MLEVAHMGLHVAQMTGARGMRDAFDAVTVVPAKILGIDDYGIALGNPANCVLLDARDPVEAIRLRATRRYVIKNGAVISQMPSAHATLSIGERRGVVDFRLPSGDGV